jgi:uncharacterized protein YidB (DUF937 family)
MTLFGAITNGNLKPPSSHEENDMSREYPSLKALLALLAVAGYQNRDKLAELFGRAQSPSPRPADAAGGEAPQQDVTGGLGGLLSSLGAGGAAGGLGGLLSGGLRDLVNRFNQAGQGEVASSWVGTGPNQPVAPTQLEQAIGPDMLTDLAKQTGLSREEILARLSRDLPDAVDKYTPEGRIPA